ncbi:hypothetical protein H2200_001218 [Cladophialophora chaetospira]|uniref:Heterokaryon incompatibility domain-containing protein n=1 Tax=Cladophialophora chaetospira TaxID=386627 RepID=A0AA39CNV2_9EURO|nr:hypothetical protein H2200_001218 [Cladophialophora chaetospira]
MSIPPFRQVDICGFSSLDPGTRFEPLKGSLTVVSLDAQPEYSAVSYEWGPFSASKEIEVNGQTLPIRLNLHHFLQVLRRSRTRRLLWIDAICINQAANDERGHQVRLMQDIYSNAQEVLVCLGHGLPQAEEAMWSLKKVENGVISTALSSQLPNMACLFGLSYWSRCWVAQEIVPAKTVVLFYDNISLRWTWLETVFDHLQKRLLKACNDLLQMQPLKIFRHRLRYREGTLRLSQLLNPRDKVYGLLGLAHDYQQHPGFEIDYHKDVQDLFREVIAFCALADVELPTLAYVLQQSLGMSRTVGYTGVSLRLQCFLDRETNLRGMWYRHRPAMAERMRTHKTSNFLQCDGIDLGYIKDADLSSLEISALWGLAYYEHPTRVFEAWGLSDWACLQSKNCTLEDLRHLLTLHILDLPQLMVLHILELCKKAAQDSVPTDIALIQGLETARRDVQYHTTMHLSGGESWSTRRVKDFESKYLGTLRLKLATVSMEKYSKYKLTLAVVPATATRGDNIIKFHSQPKLFCADRKVDPSLQGPVYVPDTFELNTREIASLYEELIQRELESQATPMDTDLSSFNKRRQKFAMSFAELQNTFS